MDFKHLEWSLARKQLPVPIFTELRLEEVQNPGVGGELTQIFLKSGLAESRL